MKRATGGPLRHMSRPIAFFVLLVAAACSRSPSPPPAAQPTPSPAPTFVNRVWRVDHSSSVAPGTLYVFLGDGTLVISSPGSKPMVGSWSRAGDGLVMVEESLPYQVDVLGLTASSFVIRSHNPGQPVDLAFVPADGP